MITLEDFNVRRESFRLSNGLNVVLFNRPNMPIHMMVTFMAGSRFDPIGKEGLAHFFEHMILSGTKRFPSKDLLAGFIEDLGGSIGASTGGDTLRIQISLGESTDLESGIELLSETLLNSLFDVNTMEKERTAILRELEAKKAHPTGMLSEISRPLVFQKTEVGRSTLGSAETIKSITKADLLGYYDKVVKSSLGVVTIAGDVDKQVLKDFLEKHLLLQKGETPAFDRDLPKYRDKIADFVFFDNDSLEVLLSFRTPSIMHEDDGALSILSGILTGGRTGVLKRRLRYERGLVYSVNSSNSSSVDNGSFHINAPLAKDKLQEALDIVCSELTRMAKDGPTNEELQLTKNRRIKSIKIHMQTSDDWAGMHNYRDLFFPEIGWTIEDYLTSTEGVTAEDVRNVAKKYFTQDNWYLAMTGSVDEDFVKGIRIDL
ncbi:MAG: pitrilysin family protein [Patescibacteria group bacterium]